MFDASIFPEMREDINNAIISVAKKYNMQLKVGNINFDSTKATIKLEALAGSSKEEAEINQWNKLCHMFGAKKEDYGKIIAYSGSQYKLIGFNTKARKFPVLAERVPDRKVFKLKEDALKY